MTLWKWISPCHACAARHSSRIHHLRESSLARQPGGRLLEEETNSKQIVLQIDLETNSGIQNPLRSVSRKYNCSAKKNIRAPNKRSQNKNGRLCTGGRAAANNKKSRTGPEKQI